MYGECCLIMHFPVQGEIGEDTWGEKHFSGEVAGVTATSEGNFCEILCSAQVGSSIDWKTDTVIGAGY